MHRGRRSGSGRVGHRKRTCAGAPSALLAFGRWVWQSEDRPTCLDRFKPKPAFDCLATLVGTTSCPPRCLVASAPWLDWLPLWWGGASQTGGRCSYGAGALGLCVRNGWRSAPALGGPRESEEPQYFGPLAWRAGAGLWWVLILSPLPAQIPMPMRFARLPLRRLACAQEGAPHPILDAWRELRLGDRGARGFAGWAQVGMSGAPPLVCARKLLSWTMWQSPVCHYPRWGSMGGVGRRPDESEGRRISATVLPRRPPAHTNHVTPADLYDGVAGSIYQKLCLVTRVVPLLGGLPLGCSAQGRLGPPPFSRVGQGVGCRHALPFHWLFCPGTRLGSGC